MRIKYLGTAAAEGWPALFCTCESCLRAKALGGKNIRTRSQAIIDDALLVDFPPDTYLHMLRDSIDLPHLHHLLITHTHDDHLHLADIAYRGPWFANNPQGMLTLYGNDALLRKYAAFTATQPAGFLDDVVSCIELPPFTPATIGDHTVTPVLASHDKAERCYLYLVERGNKALFYGNDTGYFPQETWSFLKGRRLDLVSLDCTAIARKEGTNHMGLEDVFEVQDRLLDEGIAHSSTVFVVTHFSHNGLLLHEEIEARCAPRGFLVAYDGMEVSV